MRGAVEDHDKKWLQVKGCCFRRETNQVWPGACLSCRSITDFGWRCTCHSRQAMPERALLTSCSSCLTRPPTYVSFAQPDGDIVFARTFILTLTRTRARRRLSPNSPQNRRLLARRFSRAARWTHKASAEIWSSSNPQWLIFNPAIKISPPVFVGSPLSACFSVDPEVVGRRPPFCFARDSLILQTNLRQAHECGDIIPKIDLHLWAALEIDDRSYCCLCDSTRRQRDDYTVADMVLPVIGLSLGGHRLLNMAGEFAGK